MGFRTGFIEPFNEESFRKFFSLEKILLADEIIYIREAFSELEPL